MEFKKIKLPKHVVNLHVVEGNEHWYWASDYCDGDLYEASELHDSDSKIRYNRLFLIQYPSGQVIEPLMVKEGQFFGSPLACDDQIYLLVVDFVEKLIFIYQFIENIPAVKVVTKLSLETIEDCYNLQLGKSPLYLARQGYQGGFQLLWPECMEFETEKTEYVSERIGDYYLSSYWNEIQDDYEEVRLRHYKTGEIIKNYPGVLMKLPNGQRWLIQEERK